VDREGIVLAFGPDVGRTPAGVCWDVVRAGAAPALLGPAAVALGARA
jgi:hypothetical protein